MRALLRLLSVLGLALSSLVFLGGPAHACSCVNEQTAKKVDRADQVFTGTIVDSEQSGGRFDDVVLDVAVDRVFKGEVTGQVQVETASSSASCGLGDLPTDTDYVFFTSAEASGRIEANLCGGSAPATDQLVKKVESASGPGATPPDGATESSGADGAGKQPVSSADGSGDGSGDDDGVPVWPFIGGVLIIALAAGTWAARRTT